MWRDIKYMVVIICVVALIPGDPFDSVSQGILLSKVATVSWSATLNLNSDPPVSKKSKNAFEAAARAAVLGS